MAGAATRRRGTPSGGNSGGAWRRALGSGDFDLGVLHFIGHVRPALLTLEGAGSAPASAGRSDGRLTSKSSGPNGGKYMIFRDLRKPFAARKRGENAPSTTLAPLYSSNLERVL
jgi:hypothetical protein